MPCHADEVSYSGLSFSVVNETWMFTTASQNDWSESANEKSKLRQTNQLRRRKLTPVNKLSVLSLPHWPHCSFHIPFTFPKFHEKEFNLPKKNPTCKSLPWGKDTADWNILLAAICSITSVTVGCCSRDGPRLLETWWWRAAAGPQRKGLSRKGCLK